MHDLVRYPLDITGENSDNLIKKEKHILKDLRIRAVAPYYGAFFGDSLRIFDNVHQRFLVKNKDFVTAEILVNQTTLTGRPVNGVALVISRQVSNDIEIDYQCLGAEHFRNNQSIENLLKVEHDDVVSYSFLDISKKPESFQPAFHIHNVAEIYGLDYLVFLLESLRNAIVWKKIDLCTELIDRINAEMSTTMNDVFNVSDGAMSKFLADFRHAFDKKYYDLSEVVNLRSSTQYEGKAIASGGVVSFSDEAYITLESISFFKEELYSLLVSKNKTGLGYERGVVGVPTKAFLANAATGFRFFLDSYDVLSLTGVNADITVIPDLTARRTKFSIYKVSNYTNRRGGLFMATNLATAQTFIGKITEVGPDLLVEWKPLQVGKVTDTALLELVNHLGDQTNPHLDHKGHVELELLENLSVASKEDVLTQSVVRKYVTAENLQLFMKGFMAGRADESVIEPDPEVNVMSRFDVVFSNCGDNLVGAGSGVCAIEEMDFSFTVFTQRVKYRNAKRLTENPALSAFNPVIYEGFTKLNGKQLETDFSNRSGIKLVNIPKVLSMNQTWNFGTLYHGYRSGLHSYETTDPYYETLLVVRNARTRPSINGALEVYFIKSYEELLTEYAGVQGLSDEFEFQMKRGDYLVCFRAFNKPTEGAPEQAILDFERIEQKAKVEIFSTGYTFFLDLRTAVYENYQFITLTETNSPKVIPSAHYPVLPENWFNHKLSVVEKGMQSTVLVGRVKSGNQSLDLEPNASFGINTLVENYRESPRRPGYVHGTLGMSVITLNDSDSNGVQHPTPVEYLPRDDFYDGILGIDIENDRATVAFQEQLDLGKNTNYNVYLDPFADTPGITRARPYRDYKFSNPYASGNSSEGDNMHEAFLSYMTLGFNKVNALNTSTVKLNSSQGTLTLAVKNPQNPAEEWVVEVNETVRQNAELFDALYNNYVVNQKRKRHWAQPTAILPFIELLEIPKRFVNQYRQQYRIVDTEGVRTLAVTDDATLTDLEVDIIEVGRLENTWVIADYEPVQYNALFNNVGILKKWQFKGLRPVIRTADFARGERYPVYPDFPVDRGINGDEKLVTVFGVADVNFSTDEKYREGLYDALNFTVNAVNDLARREIIITIPDDTYDDIIAEINSNVDNDDTYVIAGDGFSTFDAMYGSYDHDNHMAYDRDTKTITINMAHIGLDEQSLFFKYHLKYIKWAFRIELAPSIFTSVPYPVMEQDFAKARYEFVYAGIRNFGHNFKAHDFATTDFEFSYVGIRKMLHETRFQDVARTKYEFKNVTVKRVVYSREIAPEPIKSKFEFVHAGFRFVSNYIVYSNYTPEPIRSKFELVNVSVKTVRIP